MFRLCFVCLVFVILVVTGLRRSGTGWALLVLRENERGVQVFGVNATRTKLTGFVLSGFGAAAVGCLYVYLIRSFVVGSFTVGESFGVFMVIVIGGLGSQTGAILGVLFARGGTWFLPGAWQLLSSAIGVLFVFFVLSGGFGGLVFGVRDRWLASVVCRWGVVVFGLGFDVAVGADGDGDDAVFGCLSSPVSFFGDRIAAVGVVAAVEHERLDSAAEVRT